MRLRKTSGSRSRSRATLAMGLAVAVVAGLCVAISSIAAPRYLAVCSDGGDVCIDSVSFEAASGSAELHVLPINSASTASLTVQNHNAIGATQIGVVGYFRGDPAAESYIAAGDVRRHQLRLGANERGSVDLGDVPAGAKSVLLQVNGSTAAALAAANERACAGSIDRGAKCSLADVAFSECDDAITREQVREALRRYSHHGATPTPTATVIDDVTDAVGSTPTPSATPEATPARLALKATAGDASATVAWTFAAGSEAVSGISITRGGSGADGTGPITKVVTPESGTLVLDNLVNGTLYAVSAAPVIDGVAGAPVTVDVTPRGATSAPVPTPEAPAPSVPSSPVPTPVPASSASAGSSGVGMPVGDIAGWKQIYSQDFNTNAVLGQFANVYRGWAGYDGGQDSSRTVGRPTNQIGIYNSKTTSTVHDGLYDCYVHTAGVTPQVCALTPTPNGQYVSGQLYGRYSVRFKIDPVPGYKIAWLLWPSSGNWNEGEIDFPEAGLDGEVQGAAHNIDGTPSKNAWLINTHQYMDKWQTATIEWRPGRLTYILDDQSWTTTTRSAIPVNPMRWALQAESQIAQQAPAASASGHIYIDWLAGYSYTG